MDMSAIWQRSDLRFPPSFDTIFFDIDGVLIHTKESYRAANIAVTEYVVGVLHGLDWGQREGQALVTPEDIEAFKQAGGFNDDFILTYLLTALFTARLREWRGNPLAERSIAEWATLARAAQLQGHGGRVWTDEVMPDSARLDFSLVRDLHIESYWGAQEVRNRFGREPRYIPQAEGFVRNEKFLCAPDFFAHLRTSGIARMLQYPQTGRKKEGISAALPSAAQQDEVYQGKLNTSRNFALGMITGRVGPEVDSALERLLAYSGEQWWDVVVPATQYAKPDPQALRYAIAAVGARGGLFIGDTADDLDLVLNYRASQQDGEPEMLVAMVALGEVAELYRARGADLVVQGVEDLLDWVNKEHIRTFSIEE